MSTYYVFGYPLELTHSPLIHHKFFKRYNIAATYKAKPLNQKDFTSFFKKRYFSGANITTPYKKVALEFVDELTEEAKKCGNINTVYFKDNILIGDNTDGLGFLEVINKRKVSFKNQSVLLIGAGALAHTIMKKIIPLEPASILVANRSITKAQALNPKNHCILEEAHIHLPKINLLINTIPSYPLDLQLMPTKSWVMDFTYNKSETPYSLQARTKNLNFISGEDFLLSQAVLSFQKWFPFYKNIFHK